MTGMQQGHAGSQASPFSQQPQWDIMTAEELEKYNKQISEERGKITYP